MGLFITQGKCTKLFSVVFGISSLIYSNISYSAESKPEVKSEVLLKTNTSWDGTPYKEYPKGKPELTVLKITIPPNSSLNWHTHPMPNAAYVLSGSLTVEKKDGKQQHITKGQVLAEMVNELHRGVTGDEPVELVVFYAGTNGLPLSNSSK